MEILITNNVPTNSSRRKLLNEVSLGKLSPDVKKVYIRMHLMEYFIEKILHKVIKTRQEEINDKMHNIIYSIDDCLLDDLNQETILLITNHIKTQSEIKGITVDETEIKNELNCLKLRMS